MEVWNFIARLLWTLLHSLSKEFKAFLLNKFSYVHYSM